MRLYWKCIIVAVIAIGFTAGLAFGQSSPVFTQGQVPTPAQWQSYFRAKQDYPLVLPSCGALQWTPGVGIQCNFGASTGLAAGVSCSGTPTASFAVTNGIVTHC